MDDVTRHMWQMCGFHNALAQADAAEALTPAELDAMPTYRLWQRFGLRHVTLADAVAERARLREKEA